jgi:hypothetical protein
MGIAISSCQKKNNRRYKVHDSSFGKQVFIFGASLSGEIPQKKWEEFLPRLCRVAGLKPSHEGKTFDYPLEPDGTYIGFIHIQPIITSFVALDVWPNHNGGYLHICSCEQFNIGAIKHLLQKRFVVTDSFQRKMELCNIGIKQSA